MENLKAKNLHLGAQFLLRILTIGTTMAAAWLMMTSKEITFVYGLPLDAKYSYVSAFKFYGIASIITCAVTTISLLFLFVANRKTLNSRILFVLFLHDLFMMSLMLSANAAATAVGLIGKYGNSHAGWMPICDELHMFCNRVLLSTAFGYCSMVLLLVLTIMSASKSREILV